MPRPKAPPKYWSMAGKHLGQEPQIIQEQRNIWLIPVMAPPGAGKSTICKTLNYIHRSCKHIALGAYLRKEWEAKTPLGKMAHEFLRKGKGTQHLPPWVVPNLLWNTITRMWPKNEQPQIKPEQAKGEEPRLVETYLFLDGFPANTKDWLMWTKLLEQRKHQLPHLNIRHLAYIEVRTGEEIRKARLEQRSRDQTRHDDLPLIYENRRKLFEKEWPALKRMLKPIQRMPPFFSGFDTKYNQTSMIINYIQRELPQAFALDAAQSLCKYTTKIRRVNEICSRKCSWCKPLMQHRYAYGLLPDLKDSWDWHQFTDPRTFDGNLKRFVPNPARTNALRMNHQ